MFLCFCQGEGAGCGQGCSLDSSRGPQKASTFTSHAWPAFQTQPAGFRGAGSVPKHQGSGVRAFPGTRAGRMLCQGEQHTAHLPFPAPKTQAKTPGEMSSVGITAGCLLAAFQRPRGLSSTHRTRSRGLRALAHGWRSPYAAVEHLALPLGRHLRVPSASGFALVLGDSYVRERESGGGEPGFIGQKMEVRGS